MVLAWLLTNQFPCLSQTNFGISAGVDVAKMKAISNQGGFEILESGYGNRSIVGGLRIEQKLNNSFFLSLRGLYTKKKVDATDNGIVPFKKLEINEIKMDIALNWVPYTTFSIGAGLSQDFMTSINKIRLNDSKEEITGGRRELGSVIYAGYFFKNFLLEATYYNGYKVTKTIRKTNRIEPIKSFGISFSYMLRVFDKRKGKENKNRRI